MPVRPGSGPAGSNWTPAGADEDAMLVVMVLWMAVRNGTGPERIAYRYCVG